MGWRDRDYAARDTGYGGAYRPVRPMLRGPSVVTILITINVAVFVLAILTTGMLRIPGEEMFSSPVFFWMMMHPQPVMEGQVWRIITAQYLHWNFMHIFMNMLGLHFLGRPLERDWGPKRFLVIYSIAGTLGMVALMGLVGVGWLHAAPAAGASGCVLGLLGACAVRYPDAVVFIHFLFPIKIRTAALLFAGMYILNLYQRGQNAGGDACHLAGLVFGAWWAYRGEGWWDRAAWAWAKRQGQPKRVRVRRFTPDFERRLADEETIDSILKKVYNGGIHSLSEAEKRALHEATDRQRSADGGRVDGG